MTLPTMVEHKADLIRRALREAEGHAVNAAKLIGVSQTTIYDFLKKNACSDRSKGA